MLAVEVVVAVAVLCGIAWMLSRDEPGLDEVEVDRSDLGLPEDRLLRADDIDRLRFRAVAGIRGGIRGYRFGDVDAAMEKVEETLRAYETRATGAPTSGPLAGPGRAGAHPLPPRRPLVPGGPTLAAPADSAPAEGESADPAASAAPEAPAKTTRVRKTAPRKASTSTSSPSASTTPEGADQADGESATGSPPPA